MSDQQQRSHGSEPALLDEHKSPTKPSPCFREHIEHANRPAFRGKNCVDQDTRRSEISDSDFKTDFLSDWSLPNISDRNSGIFSIDFSPV